jgi:hypothetical protein
MTILAQQLFRNCHVLCAVVTEPAILVDPGCGNEQLK